MTASFMAKVVRENSGCMYSLIVPNHTIEGKNVYVLHVEIVSYAVVSIIGM